MRIRSAIAALAFMGLLPVYSGAQAGGLPVASFAAGGTGLTSFYVIGFELGPWQEYLAQELTPEYMIEADALPVRVSWLKSSELMIMPDFAAELEQQPDSWMNLNFEWQSSGDYFVPGADAESAFLGTSFQRQYFAPGFEHEFNDNGVLGV